MADLFYSVIEDGEETFMGVPIPRDKNLLYRSIIKNIRLYTNGYFRIARKDRSNLPIAIWKLRVYEAMINELESIVGINSDTKGLRKFVKNLRDMCET